MKKLVHVAGLVLMLLASSAKADSVTYLLDQGQSSTNPIFVDNVNNYLSLLITSVTAGSATFTLTPTLSPSLGIVAGANYGIDSFGFNVNGTSALTGASFSGLAAGWSLTTGFNQDGFGNYEYVVRTTGQGRVSPLTFTVNGLTAATPSATLSLFQKNSVGNAGEGNFFFASHLAGFTQTGSTTTSAFFAGSSAAPVPEPETYGMLLGGLGLMGLIARRKKLTT